MVKTTVIRDDSLGKPPELTKEEVGELKRLVAEGRPWKTPA